eukprot:899625-Rhodomonas_salina.1
MEAPRLKNGGGAPKNGGVACGGGLATLGEAGAERRARTSGGDVDYTYMCVCGDCNRCNSEGILHGGGR